MFPTSTVGRKIVMALTGQFMVFYVIAHVIGNSTIYAQAINAYAEGLRHWPFVVVLWSSRLLLFISILLHAFYGVVLWLENRRAKPGTYAISSHLSATFAGRNMIWTGIIVGIFLLFHLLHFTFQIIDPSTAAIGHPDALGRPDVFIMVLRSFQHIEIVSLYIIALDALLLHISHGIQSSFQTWGMNNEQTIPVVQKAGNVAAIILFLGYAAIPVSIALGMLK